MVVKEISVVWFDVSTHFPSQHCYKQRKGSRNITQNVCTTECKINLCHAVSLSVPQLRYHRHSLDTFCIRPHMCIQRNRYRCLNGRGEPNSKLYLFCYVHFRIHPLGEYLISSIDIYGLNNRLDYILNLYAAITLSELQLSS